MPPRFAYWTIILEGKPTAFRAQDREDLLPTLRQLQLRHPDTVLMWFSRGRLWTSPEEAQAAERRGAERRRPDWRPGGQHRDPRARFDIPRDEKRRRFASRLRRDRRDGPGGPEAGEGRPPRDARGPDGWRQGGPKKPRPPQTPRDPGAKGGQPGRRPAGRTEWTPRDARGDRPGKPFRPPRGPSAPRGTASGEGDRQGPKSSWRPREGDRQGPKSPWKPREGERRGPQSSWRPREGGPQGGGGRKPGDKPAWPRRPADGRRGTPGGKPGGGGRGGGNRGGGSRGGGGRGGSGR